MALRNTLCGDVRWGECASDGGTGMHAAGFWRRVSRSERERLTPERPELLMLLKDETGRERGISDVGEDVCDIKGRAEGVRRL